MNFLLLSGSGQLLSLFRTIATGRKLLHAYNIAAYPDWKIVKEGHVFTLVFEGLDKNCLLFDFLEDIPEIGGFTFENIRSNDIDVYWVDVD